jgi:sugar O-acyltransferase (sialic acid O-acetyltransferase NeuD family)
MNKITIQPHKQIKKTRLLIVGAGGHGRSIAETAVLIGDYEVVGFLDDSSAIGESFFGIPVIGPIDSILEHRSIFDQVILAIGNNKVREMRMLEMLAMGLHFATIVHPYGYVSPSAILGFGAVVMARGVVGTEAYLGVGAIVNSGAVVDHHAIVEEYAHLGVNASMAGGTFLGRGSWMQAGAVLGYGAKVEPWKVIPPREVVVIN